MKLFRRSVSYPWPPAWQLDTGATLWRVLFSGDGRILGEARNLEEKRTWFFCAREEDGAVLWNDLRPGEPWWIGIEDVAEGRFYLHGFRKPDMPQHLGVFAHDLDSGKELWRNEELAFLFAFDGSVYAAQERFNGMHVLRLSVEDGSVVEELGQQNEQVTAMRAMLNERAFAGYRYPRPFDESHPDFGMLRERVHAEAPPDQVTGALDVWQENGVLAMAWHEALPAGRGRVRQRFSVLDAGSGTPLYRDTIVDDAQGPGVDSFFVKDHLLYYVKNYRFLTAHDLSGVTA
jgi:hypothetical protein